MKNQQLKVLGDTEEGKQQPNVIERKQGCREGKKGVVSFLLFFFSTIKSHQYHVFPHQDGEGQRAHKTLP